jgi:hypothetical protein
LIPGGTDLVGASRMASEFPASWTTQHRDGPRRFGLVLGQAEVIVEAQWTARNRHLCGS